MTTTKFNNFKELTTKIVALGGYLKEEDKYYHLYDANGNYKDSISVEGIVLV